MRVCCIALALLGTTSVPPVSAGQALRLQIVRGAASVSGSCTLIHRNDADGHVTLYFVTAARLFANPEGLLAPVASVVVDPAGARLTLRPDSVMVPVGTFVEVALLRADVEQSAWTPEPIAFDPPPLKAPFAIVATGDSGARAEVSERVRFASTLLVAGDRDASRIGGCVGAAAVDGDGIFGVVTACDPQKAPMVALLRGARGFLERYVPGLRGVPTLSDAAAGNPRMPPDRRD